MPKCIVSVMVSADESVRNFGRTVRHELLTPLTVILSTIEASLKTKKYKEGLESSKLDLIESLNSLQLLGNLVPDKQNFTRVNINEVIDEEIQFVKKTLSSTKQIRFFPDCTVKLNANLTGVHIVIRNLLNNAIKYSCDSDSISIFLDNQSIKIENQISDIVNKGMGVGLKIVKEICNYHKWKFETKKTSKTFKVIIKFNL